MNTSTPAKLSAAIVPLGNDVEPSVPGLGGALKLIDQNQQMDPKAQRR